MYKLKELYLQNQSNYHYVACLKRYKMTSNAMVVFNTICLLTFIINLVTSKPVSLVIRRETSSDYLLHLNFYNDTFQQFYTCMTQSNSSKCFLNYKYDQQHPYRNDDIYVETVTEQGVIFPSDLDYFSCTCDQSRSQVICERHTGNSSDGNQYQSVRLCGLSSSTQCARLLPSVPGEKLLYNSATDNIQECSTSCTQTTPSTTSLTSRLVTVLSSLPTKPAASSDYVSSTNDNKGNANKETDNNNNLPVIVGAVCGTFVAVIVIVIGLFLWRRHRLKIKKYRQDQDHGVSSVATHGNERNGYQNIQPDKTSSSLPKTPGSTSSFSCTETGNRQTTGSNDGNRQTKQDINGYRYNNTLDRFTQHVNDVISIRDKNTLDDDYEYADDPDHIIIDAVVAEGDHGYAEIDVTIPEDDYSLAQNADSLDVTGTTSGDKSVYTRLGEKIQDKINPYNDLLQPKVDPKSRQPLPDPVSKKEQNNEVKSKGVEIVPSAKLPGPPQEFEGNSHHVSNSNNHPVSNSNNHPVSNSNNHPVSNSNRSNIQEKAADELPEYAVVVKNNNKSAGP